MAGEELGGGGAIQTQQQQQTTTTNAETAALQNQQAQAQEAASIQAAPVVEPQPAKKLSLMGYEVLQQGQTPTPGVIYGMGEFSSQVYRVNQYGSTEIWKETQYNPNAAPPVAAGEGGLYLSYQGGKTPIVSTIYTPGAVAYQGDPTQTGSVQLPGQVNLFAGYGGNSSATGGSTSDRGSATGDIISPVPQGGYYGMEGTPIIGGTIAYAQPIGPQQPLSRLPGDSGYVPYSIGQSPSQKGFGGADYTPTQIITQKEFDYRTGPQISATSYNPALSLYNPADYVSKSPSSTSAPEGMIYSRGLSSKGMNDIAEGLQASETARLESQNPNKVRDTSNPFVLATAAASVVTGALAAGGKAWYENVDKASFAAVDTVAGFQPKTPVNEISKNTLGELGSFVVGGVPAFFATAPDMVLNAIENPAAAPANAIQGVAGQIEGAIQKNEERPGAILGDIIGFAVAPKATEFAAGKLPIAEVGSTVKIVREAYGDKTYTGVAVRNPLDVAQAVGGKYGLGEGVAPWEGYQNVAGYTSGYNGPGSSFTVGAPARTIGSEVFKPDVVGGKPKPGTYFGETADRMIIEKPIVEQRLAETNPTGADVLQSQVELLRESRGMQPTTIRNPYEVADQMQGMTPGLAEPMLGVLKDYPHKIGGSYGQAVQSKTYSSAKDIDIYIDMPQKPEIFGKIFEVVKEKYGTDVKMTGADNPSGGVEITVPNGEKIVFDVHQLPPAGSFEPRFGGVPNEPTINIEGLQFQALKEQFARKLTATTYLTKGEGEAINIGPELHRGKDIADVITAAKTQIEAGQTTPTAKAALDVYSENIFKQRFMDNTVSPALSQRGRISGAAEQRLSEVVSPENKAVYSYDKATGMYYRKVNTASVLGIDLPGIDVNPYGEYAVPKTTAKSTGTPATGSLIYTEPVVSEPAASSYGDMKVPGYETPRGPNQNTFSGWTPSDYATAATQTPSGETTPTVLKTSGDSDVMSLLSSESTFAAPAVSSPSGPVLPATPSGNYPTGTVLPYGNSFALAGPPSQSPSKYTPPMQFTYPTPSYTPPKSSGGGINSGGGRGFPGKFESPFGVSRVIPALNEEKVRRKKKQPKRLGFGFVETFSFNTNTTFPGGVVGPSPIPEAMERAAGYLKQKRANQRILDNPFKTGGMGNTPSNPFETTRRKKRRK